MAKTASTSDSSPAAKLSPMEKKIASMKGMGKEAFADATKTQLKHMPAPRVIPSSQSLIAKKLGRLLYKAEELRIKGSKKLPMYPLEWKNDQCTGNVLEMGRVSARVKKAKGNQEDESEPNPNFGRFFFCRKVPLFNKDGTPKMRSWIAPDGQQMEVAETGFATFQWLDETPFSKSGTLDLLLQGHPTLATMMRAKLDATKDEEEQPLWPEALLDFMYLSGHTDDEMIDAFTNSAFHKSAGKKRKAEEEEGEEDEDESDAESEEEPEVRHVPKKKKVRAGKSARYFIDDEADEG